MYILYSTGMITTQQISWAVVLFLAMQKVPMETSEAQRKRDEKLREQIFELAITVKKSFEQELATEGYQFLE